PITASARATRCGRGGGSGRRHSPLLDWRRSSPSPSVAISTLPAECPKHPASARLHPTSAPAIDRTPFLAEGADAFGLVFAVQQGLKAHALGRQGQRALGPFDQRALCRRQ